MHKIGIDLGGTKIEGILVDEKYNTIQRKRIETNQENGYASIVKSIPAYFQCLFLMAFQSDIAYCCF